MDVLIATHFLARPAASSLLAFIPMDIAPSRILDDAR
jgi:hypothetical protein